MFFFTGEQGEETTLKTTKKVTTKQQTPGKGNENTNFQNIGYSIHERKTRFWEITELKNTFTCCLQKEIVRKK